MVWMKSIHSVSNTAKVRLVDKEQIWTIHFSLVYYSRINCGAKCILSKQLIAWNTSKWSLQQQRLGCFFSVVTTGWRLYIFIWHNLMHCVLGVYIPACSRCAMTVVQMRLQIWEEDEFVWDAANSAMIIVSLAAECAGQITTCRSCWGPRQKECPFHLWLNPDTWLVWKQSHRENSTFLPLWLV